MHRLDGSFKEARLAHARRRRQARNRQIALWAGLASASILTLVLVLNLSSLQTWFGRQAPEYEPGFTQEEVIAPAEFVPAIVDLKGDPLRISLGETFGAEQSTRLVPRPEAIPAGRAIGEVAVLTDTMVTASQRFMTTLPSSPTDFAFYQSQRQRSVPALQPATFEEPVEASGSFDLEEDSAGWGETLSSDADALEVVEATPVSNTTTVASVRSESRRFQPDKDFFVRVLVSRSLQSVLVEIGITADEARLFDEAMGAILSKTALDAGDVVGVRALRQGPADASLRVVQVSVNSSSGYLGTLSRTEDGTIKRGADPWVEENLFDYQGEDEVAQPGRQYRLLDAIYSTAIRNQVPTGVLGEAIMLLSRSFDLNAFASDDDKLILAYAKGGIGDEGGVGRVLFVGVRGKDRNIECFVYKGDRDADYSCYVPPVVSPTAPASAPSSQASTVPGGMVTPVNGVLTSRFGPRMHPIFKEVRVHKGVDWAAPTGTPVFAAFAGKVAFAGNGGGYGNLLKVAHPDGRETRYAHLSAFADGMAEGSVVAAGDLIGYVGTTGNSTGPHLHFELHMGGTAVDPLQTVTAAVFVSDGSAVDQLTDQIIQVESAGNARAKNPNSTATGLGQFLEGTWLDMMRKYRPDLSNSMTRQALLELRFDPTISREMVQHLAREGESYLKARGHAITAGRLYLCHFLGMQDAHRLLSQPPGTMVETFLSAGVVNANGSILRGQTVAQVEAWAERKMRGSGAPRPAAPAPAPAPALPGAPVPAPPQNPAPLFELYKKAIEELLSPPPPPAAPAVVAQATS